MEDDEVRQKKRGRGARQEQNITRLTCEWLQKSCQSCVVCDCMIVVEVEVRPGRLRSRRSTRGEVEVDVCKYQGDWYSRDCRADQIWSSRTVETRFVPGCESVESVIKVGDSQETR